MKSCEQCERGAIAGERFCRGHRGSLLREMRRTGYLTPIPRTAWTTDDLWQAGDFPAAEEMSDRIVTIF